MNPSRRNLILAAVGDDSQHPTWLTGFDRRTFDLALVYYGNQSERFSGDAEYYAACRGFKYHLIADFLDRHADAVDRYDYVWLPDDDLAATPDDLDRLFQIAREYELSIAQPAIAAGDVSYRVFRRQPELLLRYTGFVEVMCPLFSQAALRSVRSTFRETESGWGIDWAWTRLVDDRKIAVVDAVPVHHTRPHGTGDAYRKFDRSGVVPSDELRAILRKYGMYNLPHRLRRRQMKYDTASCRAVDLASRSLRVGPPWWKRWSRAA